MVDKLCEKHNKTPEEVYETNYIDCLNWLSMYNEKEKYIRSVEKQNKR